MKVTVCEFPDEMSRKEAAWSALCDYLRHERSDLVVLPEMPFCDWIFADDKFDLAAWRQAIAAHDRMLDHLGDLPVDWVLGSRPIEHNGARLNQAFLWSRVAGCQPIRAKWYLPDEGLARETTWFHQGDRTFEPTPVKDLMIGVQLCSEMMYPEHARELGFKGAHLIAQPRCSSSHRLWSVAASASALASGCYIASSNRRSFDRTWFAGGSWILSPNAEVVAETAPDIPFASCTVDGLAADAARSRYPRSLFKMYGGSS